MKALKWDRDGLMVAVAQDRLTGEVRMVAWMNQEALDLTLRSKKATFFSRSRQRLWKKGEESQNELQVSSVYLDCDRDTVLLQVDPVGPSCHTGAANCFIDPELQGSTANPALPFLQELEQVIEARQKSTAEKSYTKSLLEAGAPKIGEKIREEAGEFADAVTAESLERVISEAADVIFHLMVGLRHRDVSWRQVIEALAGRFGTSGHTEKQMRSRGKNQPPSE